MKNTLLLLLAVFLLQTTLPTPGPAQTDNTKEPVPSGIMKNVDAWLSEQIRQRVKKDKGWKWATKMPSEDHFPTFNVTVNGRKIETVKFQEISYADIPNAPKFDIEITANIPLESVQISPRSYHQNGVIEQRKLADGIGSAPLFSKAGKEVMKLSLDQPRKLILTFNNDYRLFLFANGPEKYPVKKDAPSVVPLSKYQVDSTGQQDATDLIQQAIDDVSKIKGTLYIPRGCYKINQLRMKDDVTLYLERGAVLKLSDDREKQLAIREENLKFGIQFFAPILCYKVKNVRICGYGTIDGNGDRLAQRNDFTTRGFFRLVHSVDCQNLQICDVILKNPQRWNTHLANTENILLENIKIINSINICNTDAIDPDNSKNVLIKNVFAYSSDDSVVIKTSARWHDSKRTEKEFINSENIRACDSVFWTRANALKIGTETFRNIKNVVFENNDIVHSYCVLTLELKEGSKTDNVQFVNNRVETIGDVSKGRLLNFAVRRYIYQSQINEVSDRPSYGQLTNVLIKDLSVDKKPVGRSKIEGWDENSFIKNVTFDNVLLEGTKVLKPEQFDLKIGKYADGILFK